MKIGYFPSSEETAPRGLVPILISGFGSKSTELEARIGDGSRA
jgi:hypothetical protein